MPISRPIRLAPIAATAVCVVLILSITAFVAEARERSDLEDTRQMAESRLEASRALIEESLQSYSGLVTGLTALVRKDPDVSHDDFYPFAGALASRRLPIRSLQLAPNAVIQHVYPLAGNEALIGKDLMADPTKRPSVERAIKQDGTVLGGPYKLVSGATGLIARAPIYVSTDQDPRLWGIASAVIDLPALAQEARLMANDQGLQFALRGVDGRGAEGEVFFGDASIFEADPALIDITVPGGSWQMAAVPIAGWTKTGADTWLIWLAGASMAVLGGSLMWNIASTPLILRRRVDEATRQAQGTASRLSALIENLQIGVLVEDEDRKIVHVNQRFCEIFDLPAAPEQLVGTDCEEAAEAAKERFKSPDAFIAGIREAIQHRAIGRDEEHETVDGRFMVRDYVPISLGEGRFGHLWQYRVITEQKRAERLMSVEKTVLGSITAGGPLQRVLDEITAGLETATPHMKAFLMLASEDGTELLSTSSPSLPIEFAEAVDKMAVAPDSGVCGMAAFLKTRVTVADLAGDPRVSSKLRGLAASFGLASATSTPIIGSNGNVLGTFALFGGSPVAPAPEVQEVISRATHLASIAIEKSRAEQKLIVSEERYRAISEMTSDYAYSIKVGKGWDHIEIEWVTEAFTKITGYEREEATSIGGYTGMVHPEDLPKLKARIADLEAGKPVVVEFRIITRRGSTSWLRDFARPILDPKSGRTVRVYGAAQDVTGLKEAEEAKNMFLATTSHELKTPLTVIRGFARLILEGRYRTQREMQAGLEAIERRAISLNKIVDRILLSSRIEAGSFRLHPEEVDVVGLVASRTSELETATGRLVLTITSDTPAIARGTEDAITTVIDHLLDNAVKYSPAGGAIEVHVSDESGRVEISITDHGIGMDPEQVEHCFDKFWQADSSDTRAFGGTGIGLYIVRSLAEAMGGTVRAQSERGGGTTFTLSLPSCTATRTPPVIKQIAI